MRPLIVPAIALLAGCGTLVTYTPSGTKAKLGAPRAADQVELLSAPPGRPYLQAGLMNGKQESKYSVDGTDAIYQKMRIEAGQRGCDALIIQGSDDSVVGSSSTTNGNGSGSVDTIKGYRAACIVYVDSENQPNTSGSEQSACNPPCSPGYACEVGGQCKALCNPPCSPGYVCAQDRTCQSAAASKAALTAPAPDATPSSAGEGTPSP